MSSTTGGRLYLTAINSLEKLEIQYVPKEIVLDRNANIADIVIVGRNNPIHQYTSGDTTLTLELDFHAEEESREDVIRKVRLLQSWMHNDGYSKPAEIVRLTWGKLFKANEVWVIKRAPAKFSNFNPSKEWLPQQAYVSLTLALDTSENLKKRDYQWS